MSAPSSIRPAGSGSRLLSAILASAIAATPSLSLAQTPPTAGAPAGGKGAKPAAAAPTGVASPAVAAPASSAPAAATPAPAAAPDLLQGDAKRDYDAGKLLFGDGDFAGARLKFKAAYDATKDHRPLWNWAACEKNLRHYSKAQQLIADYLKDITITADERSDAERLRDTLVQFTAPVTFSVTETGADIAVDGESIGQSPLAGPVTLDMGARKVDVTKAGFKPFSTSINVGSGANPTVSVKLDADLHQGHLVIKATAGAAINIDGAAMGVGSWQGTLATGGHELRVTAPGMRTFHDEVTLLDDQTRTLDITLEPEASGMPKWVWIPIGVVAAGGLAVGGYFAFKSPGTTTQAPANGTLGLLPL
jgi:hypothetical protein